MLKRIGWVAVALFCICAPAAQGQPAAGDAEATAEVGHVDGSAPVCKEPSAEGSCGIDSIFAQVGPGEGCCERHLDMCESICYCGIQRFTCGDNGHGGCSSTCNCKACPV